MVFFTCNTCGASLKKNQVEKHYQNECPRCEVLSCMDCGRDFYGDEYASHTKCISEAEKYQGSVYKESASAGKGERKQQEWLEKVKQSVKGSKVNPRISRLLERVATYPNIPRKKAKFENFVRNSVNVRDQQTLNELWEVFSSLNQQQSSEKSGTKEQEEEGVKSVETVEQDHCNDRPSDGGGEGEGTSDELPKKKKKKKKKKLQPASSPEETERDSELIPGGSAVNCEGERSKKRKHEKELNGKITERSEEQEGEQMTSIDVTGEPPKKKKKKKKQKKDDLLRLEGVGEPAVENEQEAVEKSEVPELEYNGQAREDESQDGESSVLGKQPSVKKRKKKVKALTVALDDSEVGEEERVGPVEVALSYINGGQCMEEVKQRKRKERGEEEGEEVEREEGVKAKKELKRVQCENESAAATGHLESVANTKQKKEKSKKHKKHKH